MYARTVEAGPAGPGLPVAPEALEVAGGDVAAVPLAGPAPLWRRYTKAPPAMPRTTGRAGRPRTAGKTAPARARLAHSRAARARPARRPAARQRPGRASAARSALGQSRPAPSRRP